MHLNGFHARIGYVYNLQYPCKSWKNRRKSVGIFSPFSYFFLRPFVAQSTFMELRLKQMGDFLRKTAFLQSKILHFGGLYSAGWKFLHQTTKRHTLTPNLVEQIVWRTWQWRCFDIRERREKQHARIAIGNSMSSITLRRCCDVVKM